MTRQSGLPLVDESRLLDAITDLASAAAAAILRCRETDLAVRRKEDRSPVSAADEIADAVIHAGLGRAAAGIPVVSEESRSGRGGSLGSAFFLVDPLDGTREFLAGRDEFTVNIGLVLDGAPRLGVIAAPARGLIWRGRVGHGAERLALAPGASLATATAREPIRTRRGSKHRLVSVSSRSHADARSAALLQRLGTAEQAVAGSALKFCLVAAGRADVYPRLAPTSEWDVAAGHAIVMAAGGVVLQPDGAPLTYGQRGHGFRVDGFVAWGDPALAEEFTSRGEDA